METPTEYITPKTDSDITKVTLDTIASTSVEHVTLEMDDTVKENVGPPTIELTKDKHKLKKVQIKIRRLSAHEIEEAVKTRRKKPKQEVTKTIPKQIAKNTHNSNTLMKDTTRKMPKFTYSSYRLPRKTRKNYTFRCPISGCKRSFNSIKNWNSHHLSLHRLIRYQCSTCLKWIATPNCFNDHK